MGYDVGDVWMVKNVVNGKESEQKFTGPIVAGYGKGHAVQVSFVGTNVSVKIDDKEYYNADVLDDSLSGKLGLRNCTGTLCTIYNFYFCLPIYFL